MQPDAEWELPEEFPRIDGDLHCEEVPVTEIVSRWGTPLYVYSQNAIEARFRELDAAFAHVPHLAAFPVRANGNLTILRTLAGLGAGAEIVSAGELHRALLAGIPGPRITFAGVGKTVHELAMALRAGVHAFNVESEGELAALSDLACAMGARAPIALRVRVGEPIVAAPEGTSAALKFGLPLARASALYSIADRMPGIAIRGLDIVLAKEITSGEQVHEAAYQAVDFARNLGRIGPKLEFISFGGGAFPEEAEGWRLLALAEEAQAFASAGLRLVVTAGQSLLGEAGALLTRVLYVKESGGRRFVITDAATNDLPSLSSHMPKSRVIPASLMGREQATVDVVGPIADARDILASNQMLELPKPGELLAFLDVGAFYFARANQYNGRPRPAEILVKHDNARLIRRRDTLDELVANEIDIEISGELASIPDPISNVSPPAGDVDALVKSWRARMHRVNAKVRQLDPGDQLRKLQVTQIALAKYVDPNVLHVIEEDADWLDQPRSVTATVVFWDIRAFSHFSEAVKAKPSLIFDFLRAFNDAAIQIVGQHGGIIANLLGDGIKALFGALTPKDSGGAEDALDAVRAASQLAQRFPALIEEWTPRWELHIPEIIDIGLGCGIHTGDLLVGNIGGTDRNQFSATGPNVNLAKRLESEAGSGQVLLSASTARRVRNHFELRHSKVLTDVKNIHGNFPVYELLYPGYQSNPSGV